MFKTYPSFSRYKVDVLWHVNVHNPRWVFFPPVEQWVLWSDENCRNLGWTGSSPTSKFLKCWVLVAGMSLTKLRFSFGILTRKKKLPHFLNVYTFGAPRTWGSSGYDLTSIYSIDFSLVVSTHWLFILFVHQIGSFRGVGGENIYCRWACDPITSAGNPNLTPQRSYCVESLQTVNIVGDSLPNPSLLAS